MVCTKVYLQNLVDLGSDTKVYLENSIGVQRFVGDAKQTLEIRVERRGNRQGENRGEKSILINERLFAFFLHLYYYFKEPSGLDHEWDSWVV